LGEIIGIGGGAGIHANTVKSNRLYGLDYEQITSNGPAMAVIKAIRDKEGQCSQVGNLFRILKMTNI
jgi:glycine betaine/proline transport system substrate-binding protein